MRSVSALSAFILTAMLAACGPGSPTVPTPQDTPLPVFSDLRIVGSSTTLSPGTTIQLTAEASIPSGVRKECAAKWFSDRPDIASVAADGLLTGISKGYVQISAVCGTVTATMDAKVEAPSLYSSSVHLMDLDWGGGVHYATMEYLDGARRGATVAFGESNHLSLTSETWPVKVRFAARDYQPREFVFDESHASDVFPDRGWGPAALFRIPMTFVLQPSTDTYVGLLNPDRKIGSHAFAPQASGMVRVRSWWAIGSDHSPDPTLELWCGGRRLRRQFAPNNGEELAEPVAGGSACEVRMVTPYSDLEYRVAITYPH
jgi:hypothetical protein